MAICRKTLSDIEVINILAAEPMLDAETATGSSAVMSRFLAVMFLMLTLTGCDRKHMEAVVLEKEHIAAQEPTPTPTAEPEGPPTNANATPEPEPREATPDEAANPEPEPREIASDEIAINPGWLNGRLLHHFEAGKGAAEVTHPKLS